VADIGFYHLTRSGAEQALPRLLGRTLQAGERALVLCRTEDRVVYFDKVLWECPEPDWLPHGSLADGDPDLQPILLTAAPAGAGLDDAGAGNGARFLFLLDGAETTAMAGFARVFDLFDGNDETAVVAARHRWKAARDAGHTLTYWQQGERGWEKKA